ncbi:MAG TPA: choice-of-anchor tandem repeat GloVer-containing protein [Terriglobia bacterium]
MMLLAATGSPAQTFTTLHIFAGADGQQPYEAPLVQGTDGNLYGTTEGNPTNIPGTVFKITPGGALTTIYNFCSLSGCTDGENPRGGLVQATNGSFYGTTEFGGANGLGTVFKITPGGTLTTLYSFCSQSDCTDGLNPWGLIQAADGNFYGTTGAGGDDNCNPSGGCGTVFKITPTGTLTTLHAFTVADGGLPLGGLVQASNGSFYGTTSSGGPTGNGTVFKITPSGTLTTLYGFCSQSGCTDGRISVGTLVQATDGNLYGTTSINGANGGGTAFKITPGGTLTTLYGFCSQSGCADGTNPGAGLVQGTDGNFYGTTEFGGVSCSGFGGCGTIFKITPRGALTTLYSFCSLSGCADGALPVAGPGPGYQWDVLRDNVR